MAIRGWLAGRKTYILAAVFALTVLVLVFLGKLTGVAAYTIEMVAFAGFAVTFRSAMAEHQAQVIAVLMDVGQLGAAVRAGNRAGELAAVEDLGKQGIAAAIASGKVGGIVPDKPFPAPGETGAAS